MSKTPVRGARQRRQRVAHRSAGHPTQRRPDGGIVFAERGHRRRRTAPTDRDQRCRSTASASGRAVARDPSWQPRAGNRPPPDAAASTITTRQLKVDRCRRGASKSCRPSARAGGQQPGRVARSSLETVVGRAAAMGHAYNHAPGGHAGPRRPTQPPPSPRTVSIPTGAARPLRQPNRPAHARARLLRCSLGAIARFSASERSTAGRPARPRTVAAQRRHDPRRLERYPRPHAPLRR